MIYNLGKYNGRSLFHEPILPYDSIVEYIESTGTQWIDTLVNLQHAVTVELGIMFTKSVSSYSAVCGAFFDNSTYPKFQLYIDNNGDWGDSSGESDLYTITGVTSGSAVATNTYYNVKLTALVPQPANNTLWLFARDNDQGNYLPVDGMRIYYCRIRNEHGVIRDFIPVRKGSVGYLYDSVHNKLYSAQGTGSFSYGNDIVEVEYLESTGMQYIKIGVVLTSSDIVKATAMPANRNSIFGTTITNKQFNLTGTGSNSLLRFGSSGKLTNTTLNEIHSFECGSIFKIDGVTVGDEIVEEFSSEVECTMFARTNRTIVNDYLIGRIYSLQVLNGSILVRDFIPVRFTNELSQPEGAMYDRVTRRLFRNQGIGEFLYGDRVRINLP